MIYLYSHGGSENHGCEAIVRTTEKLLNMEDGITLYTMAPEQDEKYGVGDICSIVADKSIPIKPYSVKWFLSKVETKLTGKIDLLTEYSKPYVRHQVRKGEVCVSIGGDNYCYGGLESLSAGNRLFKKCGAKTVLWGCSVEPEITKDPKISRDLATFDLITARESITYEALKEINPNTVFVADPAFNLERQEVTLPAGWVDGKMIGINASPLILNSAKDGGLVLDAYVELVRMIIEKTENSVALIPHVVWRNNDDREPLRILFEKFKDTGRVCLIEDCNCMQLKYVISNCRAFVGARTHATIAAYSTCVPTLVVGYSVKSRGIARDLFGTEEGYVIPVWEICGEGDLAAAFDKIMAREGEIRAHLESIMPEYRERAYVGRDAVLKLMKK